MGKSIEISELLKLRKVTRDISESIFGQLQQHLNTIAPLFEPQEIFGKHVSSSSKQSVRGEDEAFRELGSEYERLVESGKLNLPRRELESPLDFHKMRIDLTPLEYSHEVNNEGVAKSVQVTTPLKWWATYGGFSLSRLTELLEAGATASPAELRKCVLHFLALQIGIERKSGIALLIDSLRFKLSFESLEEFGGLPVIRIESSIPTFLPDDKVVIESTEISGSSAFEEVVDVKELANLKDPLGEQLSEIAVKHGAV